MTKPGVLVSKSFCGADLVGFGGAQSELGLLGGGEGGVAVGVRIIVDGLRMPVLLTFRRCARRFLRYFGVIQAVTGVMREMGSLRRGCIQVDGMPLVFPPKWPYRHGGR